LNVKKDKTTFVSTCVTKDTFYLTLTTLAGINLSLFNIERHGGVSRQVHA